MIREVERVNGIIEELMDLANPRPPELTQVNLAKMLGDIVLLQKEAHRGKQIEFVLQFDPSIPPITGDETLLTSAFSESGQECRRSDRPQGPRRNYY